MDAERIVINYKAYGQDCVHPIGASWRGPPNDPIANTSRPVLVQDENHDCPQQLRPHEAELLMGFVARATAGTGVNARQCLECIGNGLDMNVVHEFFKHSKFARSASDSTLVPMELPTLLCVSDQDLQIGIALICMVQQQGTAATALSITQYGVQQQLHMLAVM